MARSETHFVTQAVGKQRMLMCFNRADGKLLWQQGVTAKEKEPTHQTNPYCSASPVTDGERVIASFGPAGVYAYDLAGQLLWKKDLGSYPMQMDWGTSSSPVLLGERVKDRGSAQNCHPTAAAAFLAFAAFSWGLAPAAVPAQSAASAAESCFS